MNKNIVFYIIFVFLLNICHAGSDYEYDSKITKNPKKAAENLRQDCNIGQLQKCAILGNMYFDGYGVAKNTSKAIALWEKACNGGYDNDQECYSLGHIYDHGIGIAKNHSKAIKFYKKACENGDENGCILLERHKQ